MLDAFGKVATIELAMQDLRNSAHCPDCFRTFFLSGRGSWRRCILALCALGCALLSPPVDRPYRLCFNFINHKLYTLDGFWGRGATFQQIQNCLALVSVVPAPWIIPVLI